MYNRCLFLLMMSAPLAFCSLMHAKESITGWFTGYREICRKASVDPYYFQNFRSMGEYGCVLELPEGDAFAEYLSGTSEKLLAKLNVFRKLDMIGNPTMKNYPILGNFSGTTLRYIVLADQMKKFFTLPDNAKIAEIGAGFGGQCYILSQLQSFSNYYIYDLPEVELLIAKMMETLQTKNVRCMPLDAELPEKKIDLVISNYAFSECDRETQMDYFERVIKKAERGYVIYNQISQESYGIGSLAPDEFIQLLKNIGIKPKVHKEFPSTAPGNLLILWDRTQQKPSKP